MYKYVSFLFIAVVIASLQLYGQESMPVTLQNFNASIDLLGIKLSWETATEQDNYGFEVQRSLTETGDWETIGFVEGHGTSYSPKQYSFTDTSLAVSGKYYYRLHQLDNNGNYKDSDVISVDFVYTNISYNNDNIPLESGLEQNFPNPFNPSTTITFSSSVDNAHVLLKLHDIRGREIATLIDSNMASGRHFYELSMDNYPAGIYFYSLCLSSSTVNYSFARKLILLK